MECFALLVAIVLAAVQVRVTTVDGQVTTGKLTQLTANAVELEETAARSPIPLDQVTLIERVDGAVPRPASVSVGLEGGSKVVVDGLQIAESTAELALRGGMPLRLPVQRLRWVRFRPPSPTVDPQWLGLVERPRVADSLVVRRPGDAVDEVSGVVLGISADSVSFSLDGEPMRAPVSRLEGVLFRSPAAEGGDVPAPSRILLEDVQGSRWVGDSLAAAEAGFVSIDLGGDVAHAISLDDIRRIEFSGSIEFLAAQSPVEVRYVPGQSIGLSADLLTTWLGPQVVDDRDLVLRATSHVEYRVGEGFRSLVGSVEIDPEVTSGDRCVVRVSLDSRVVWEQTLAVDDSSPRGFDLPLGGVRRVRFEVVPEAGIELGDTVRLRRPRMLK